MKKLVWFLASLAAGGGLGWFALRSAAWSEVLGALKSLDWRILILALLAVLFAGAMEAIRWKLLLPKEKVSTTRLFLVRYTGTGLNNVSPVRVLAEVAQTTMLRYGNGIGIDKVVSSLILTRLFDLVITMSLVGAGLIVLPQLSGFKPIVLPLWGLVAASLVAFFVLGRRMHTIALFQRFAALNSLLRAIGSLTVNRKAVAAGVTLTAISWMSVGAAAWLVAGAAGIDLPFWLMSIVIVAVTLFTGIIPAPPGAVGVYEFGVISTLGLFAVDPTAALNFALVIHGVLFLPSIVVGLAVLAGDRDTMRSVASQVSTILRPEKGSAKIELDFRDQQLL